MAESKNRIPGRSIDELVELFEAHDMSDYVDEARQVEVEIDLSTRHHLVELDDDLVKPLGAKARARKVSSVELINSFLREKLAEAT
jgi:hypothetical protein